MVQSRHSVICRVYTSRKFVTKLIQSYDRYCLCLTTAEPIIIVDACIAAVSPQNITHWEFSQAVLQKQQQQQQQLCVLIIY